MGATDRKEITRQYKERRPPMGVVRFRCKQTGDSFLEASKDIQADINSLTFKLNSGYHPNRKLLALWKEYGQDGFDIETIKTLEYDKEPRDYTEDLQLLRDICLEEDPKAAKVWK